MWQKIKNYYHWFQAAIPALFFNFPSQKLTIIGVCGTDGKTTTVNMIYQILRDAGKNVSMISSVNAQIGQKSHDTGFHVTTPDPWQVQKYLKQAVDAGSQYFVLEATSHGLDQNRLAFVEFKIGVVTNITHEHLDYHKTWRNYAQAKARLFNHVQFSVLNIDDQKSYDFLKNKVSGQVITYGFKPPSDINLKNFPIKLKLPGDYNLSNGLAAAAVCTTLGIGKSLVIKSLAKLSGIKGRMEEIEHDQDFTAIVDFAHTPNGLKNALETLRSMLTTQNSKLIAIFGAAGERDKSKRHMMGEIASQLADTIILTAEDPRSEKVEDICEQIKNGIKNKKNGKDLFIIVDRRQAIEKAVKLAQSGDIVATFGKGHEKSMTFGKKEYPWDEFAVVELAIKLRQNGK